MSVTFKDGFYLRNLSYVNGVIPLRFEAYDANKVLLPQSAPPIPYARTRFISAEHIGNIDFIYALIFFDTERFSAPPGMNIIQGQEGGGGNFGITIGGNGFSVGASASVTKAFAQPIGAIQMTLENHKFTNGTSSRWATWEVHAKEADPNNEEAPYVFSYNDVTWPMSQGPLLGW